ncbi:hypothetical protein ACTXT7_010209 [Hymenolepis weldensis]
MSRVGIFGVLVLLSFYFTFVAAVPEVGHWEVDVPVSVFEDTDISFKILCTKIIDVRLSLSVYWSECADAFADVETVNNSKFMIEVSFDLKPDSIVKNEKQTTCSPNQPVLFGTKVSRAGTQMTILSVNCIDPKNCAGMANVYVTTDIRSSYGYLSAIEYPLRTFYGVLSLSYALLGFLWLCFTICHWKDLLRIQYYISLMIFIGLIEHITFYALYETLNRTGLTLKGALVFAIVVSCFKRTLARFLILIVCVGYGITKSRLGTAYRRIVWICVVYLLCCLLDSFLRAFHPRFKPSLSILLGGLPMIVVDLAILWWSFSYLVSTLRETRMRRNKVKHRLYRIFSTLLIGVSVVSVICMGVSVFLLHWKPCTRPELVLHSTVLFATQPTLENSCYQLSEITPNSLGSGLQDLKWCIDRFDLRIRVVQYLVNKKLKFKFHNPFPGLQQMIVYDVQRFLPAWRYIWFDETFWQLLFFAVLFAIVILWRPSSTNRLYARSAFLDPDVEPPPEDLEERLLDVIVSGINDDEQGRKNSKTAATEDEALRWAEENIPSSHDNPAFSDEKSNQGNACDKEDPVIEFETNSQIASISQLKSKNVRLALASKIGFNLVLIYLGCNGGLSGHMGPSSAFESRNSGDPTIGSNVTQTFQKKLEKIQDRTNIQTYGSATFTGSCLSQRPEYSDLEVSIFD